MSTSTAAVKRYANALFLAAKDKGSVAKVEKELKLVADSLVATPALSSLLAHPGVDVTAKHKMIVEVFGKYVSELVLNMLQLLCDRRRSDIMLDLSASFTQIASRELGQAEAIVISAKPLTTQELTNVQTAFAEIIGKEIRVEQKVDAELLGGIQVRIGDTLYDGSVAGKLARIGKELQQTQAL
jgi:F-type H+-transporting ATPase subunit delta